MCFFLLLLGLIDLDLRWLFIESDSISGGFTVIFLHIFFQFNLYIGSIGTVYQNTCLCIYS